MKQQGEVLMPMLQTRRRFITGLAAASVAGLVGPPRAFSAAESLETKAVRLAKGPAICVAPLYATKELLSAEGFTDVRFVEVPAGYPTYEAMARGDLDFAANLPLAQIKAIEAGLPVTVLGGILVGCTELFVNGPIRSVLDLKGKTVGLQASPPDLLSLVAADVGLDPKKDVHWVNDPALQPLELFAQGKIDAFLGFSPEPQELHARNAGRVILNTAIDRPWSQYFCCMVAGNSDFVRQHPVATKRVLRAILKATDRCVSEPARVARQIVDDGFVSRYDYAVESLNTVLYDKWRDYDAEDSIRFYALRLHDAGLLKAIPNKIIAIGTDWRFFNELKRELKA
jgi:NitT/TauT family transport system substrate-binding protein